MRNIWRSETNCLKICHKTIDSVCHWTSRTSLATETWAHWEDNTSIWPWILAHGSMISTPAKLLLIEIWEHKEETCPSHFNLQSRTATLSPSQQRSQISRSTFTPLVKRHSQSTLMRETTTKCRSIEVSWISFPTMKSFILLHQRSSTTRQIPRKISGSRSCTSRSGWRLSISIWLRTRWVLHMVRISLSMARRYLL